MESTPIPDWGKHFDARVDLFEQLRDEVLFILNSIVAGSGIKTHLITARVKTRSSFLDKIGRKGYTDPFEDAPDLVGARVVCLFLSDLPKLISIIQDTFNIVEREDKIESAPVESFGYMSHHLVCTLRSTYSGARYDRIKDLRFEIQCRTILMDAWANVSHYLAYKGETSIPHELRRDFHALSGLFFIADKHFQLFFERSEAAAVSAAVTISTIDEPSHLELNRETLAALLRELFPDRRAADHATVSESVEEIAAAGFRDINSVRQAVSAGRTAALRIEETSPPAPTGRYLDVGLLRLALAASSSDYRSRIEAKYAWRTPPGNFS
jgi:putative GTP pyrophosphokinase